MRIWLLITTYDNDFYADMLPSDIQDEIAYGTSVYLSLEEAKQAVFNFVWGEYRGAGPVSEGPEPEEEHIILNWVEHEPLVGAMEYRATPNLNIKTDSPFPFDSHFLVRAVDVFTGS